ncbi:Hypothetical_protein [Hexamita inflata]|uniref:Hypothetical_protein n=1 Tax=Hexamita inflata TaxID=28002 RepID=A0AA86Q1A2_9EUKA|nr:Hypothetical protein HINF_LOCUS37939 [Hexamita inflata]
MNFFNNLPLLLQSITSTSQQQNLQNTNNNKSQEKLELSAEAFLKVKNHPKRSISKNQSTSYEPDFDYELSNKIRIKNQMVELKTKIQKSAKDIFRLGLQVQYLEETTVVVIDNISKTQGNLGKLYRNYLRCI